MKGLGSFLRRQLKACAGPRRQWAWVATFAMLTGLIAHMVVVHPWLEDEKGREPELKQAYVKQLASSQGLVYLEHVKQRWGELVIRLEKHLPSRIDTDAFVSDVNQAALGRGLTLKRLERNEPADELRAYYALASYTVAVTGSFEDLTDFLADIASLSRMVTVNHLHLENHAGRLVRLEATLGTYRYLSAEEIVAQRTLAAKNGAERAGAKE